jgi:hypothetical protein
MLGVTMSFQWKKEKKKEKGRAQILKCIYVDRILLKILKHVENFLRKKIIWKNQISLVHI